IDANGHRTNLTRDDLNRVIAETIDPTPGLNLVTQYSYSVGGGGGCGCGGTAGASQIKLVVDSSQKYTYFQYDVLDRRTAVVRKVGDISETADTDDAVTAAAYD